MAEAPTARPAAPGAARPAPRAARRWGLGPLGRRLLLAFSLVSLVSVGLLAIAAQQAVDRGITVAVGAGRWAVAQDLAATAAGAYARAGGWEAADLGEALQGAADAGVRLTLRDEGGAVLARSTGGLPRGQGAGAGHGGGLGAGVSVPVLVDGVEVGSASVTGGASDAVAQAQGRDVAWPWIVGAAAASLGVAVLAAALVTRRLTGPLDDVAATARAFAAGRRDVRADTSATGELGDLARGVNEAIEAVEGSARARRQMAADVAHELRTPLAALQASLEEVRDGLVPADAQTLGRLHDQTVRLGRVVGDLAVLAAADDAPLGLASGRADLARIVAEELAAREAELRAAGVGVGAVDLLPVEVPADADRLHQVVGNVLANVARHCRPGDVVRVDLRRVGREAVLTIADTGPGIGADDLPLVFDRYWRGAHARVGGSGLGLAVVREIVTAHGGSVDIRSPGRTGTTVVVRLPAALAVSGDDRSGEAGAVTARADGGGSGRGRAHGG